METIQKFKKIGEPKQTSTEKQHKDKYMITRDNFFLWKDNLQYFPIPAQSKKTRDNFFIWEDNLQLFFFMLAQSEREGGEPAQVTINKEKVVLTQVMILC